jgi:hypothetical protein
MVRINYIAGRLGKKLNKQVVWLLGLWLLSLLVRFAFYRFFLQANPCLLMYDSGHYHTMAKHLVEQGVFADASGVYDFYRMPGYPLFLAGCYWLLGVAPVVAVMVQLVISSVMPLQVFFLVGSIAKGMGFTARYVQRVSVVVALLAVFNIGWLVFSGLLMSDLLFSMIFLLWLQLMLLALPSTDWRLFLCAGLLLGICNLVRPLIFLPVCVALLLGLLASGNLQRRLQHACIFLVGWAVPVCGWLLRNWLLTGLWFLHTLSGPHLFNHGAVRVYAMAHNLPYQQAHKVLSKECAEQKIQSPQEQERFSTRLLLSYLPQTIKLSIVNCLKTVGGLYSSELLMIDAAGELPPYDTCCDMLVRAKRFLLPAVNNKAIRFVCWFELIWQLFLWVGLLGFLITGWRLHFYKLVVFLFAICLCLIATTAICGFARLRLPIESILTMVAVLFYLVGARSKGSRL